MWVRWKWVRRMWVRWIYEWGECEWGECEWGECEWDEFSRDAVAPKGQFHQLLQELRLHDPECHFCYIIRMSKEALNSLAVKVTPDVLCWLWFFENVHVLGLRLSNSGIWRWNIAWFYSSINVSVLTLKSASVRNPVHNIDTCLNIVSQVKHA